MTERCNAMRLFSGKKQKTHFVWLRAAAALVMSCVLVISAAPIFAVSQAPKGGSVDDFAAYLDERIPTVMDAYDIPGAGIAVVKDGGIVWTQAYGYADTASGREMTTDDVFRVQSISKSVTAWGVMKLVREGRIDLDSPVAQYLHDWQFPASVYPAGDITIRQLLCHTAGLYIGDFMTRYSPVEEKPTLAENLSKEAVIVNVPGRVFSYSNVGYNLLELVVEEVTGRDFAEYMRQEVLIPLGMDHADFDWREDMDVPNGYNLQGEVIPVYVYPEKASGGLFATTDDIAAFAAAGMTGAVQDVLDEESIDALYMPQVQDIGMYNIVFDGYGFGHYIETMKDGRVAVAHGGQGTGWMTHFQAVPESGDAIVILTNSQRSWPLIAYILCDWAQWRGLSQPGMGRIIWGVWALWIFIGLVWFAVLWQALRIATDLISRQRRPAPLSAQGRGRRIVRLALAVIIAGALAWCVCQDYLLLSSVFPVTSVWLAVSAAAVSVVLLLTALLPVRNAQPSVSSSRISGAG